MSGASARTSLWRSSLLVAGVTLLTKVTGFMRVTTITGQLGATANTDAFLTAFLVPESLYVFLTEGAITTAFVPAFTRALERSPADFGALVLATLGRVTALGAVVAVGLAALARPLTGLIAPHFGGAATELTAELLASIAPYVPLTAAASVAFAACHARGRFLAPALGPLLFNLAIIASVSWATADHVQPLVVGVLVGGVLQLALQLPEVGRGVPWSLRAAGEPQPGLAEITRLLAPLTFSLGVTQVQILTERMFASGLAAGVITSMNLVQKLVNLPLGLVGMAVSAPLMPQLARHHAAGERVEFAQALSRGLVYTVLAIAPLSAVCLVEPDAVVRVLFLRGAFGAAQAGDAARMLACYALGLPAVSITFLLTGAFLAQGEATRPALVRAALLTANVALNWAWIDRLHEAAIPAAWSLMYAANALALLALEPALAKGRVLARMALAVTVCPAVAWAVSHGCAGAGDLPRLIATGLGATAAAFSLGAVFRA